MYKITQEADLKNIIKTLKDVEVKTTAGFRTALKQTAEDMAKDAKNNVRKNSYKTGALHRSINTVYEKQGTQAIIQATANHASFVENGTRAHTIKPKNAKVLAFNSGNKMVFTKSVKHPGTKAKPFMEPAFNKNIPNYIKRLEDVINGANK